MQRVKDQLVDEALEDKMAAVAQREDVGAIRWIYPNYRRARGHQLHTPYGLLEVEHSWPGCWTVCRDDSPLARAHSHREAHFTRCSAAKAAGLVHLRHGFGNASRYKDGLWWYIRWPPAERPVLQVPGDFPVDPSISDDHEWGRERLTRLLKDSVETASAADLNLVLHLEHVAGSWRFRPPTWTKRAHGYLELVTPYGTLVVRRLIGWTVERDGVPLVWDVVDENEKVIFDKLEHARTSALIHAIDVWDNRRFFDGTRWDELPGTNWPRNWKLSFDQSPAEGGNGHGDVEGPVA